MREYTEINWKILEMGEHRPTNWIISQVNFSDRHGSTDLQINEAFLLAVVFLLTLETPDKLFSTKRSSSSAKLKSTKNHTGLFLTVVSRHRTSWATWHNNSEAFTFG